MHLFIALALLLTPDAGEMQPRVYLPDVTANVSRGTRILECVPGQGARATWFTEGPGLFVVNWIYLHTMTGKLLVELREYPAPQRGFGTADKTAVAGYYLRSVHWSFYGGFTAILVNASCVGPGPAGPGG